MSPPQQDRPDPPHQEDASGRKDFWGDDELDDLLANPGDAGLVGQVLAAANAPAEAAYQAGEDAARQAFRRAFPVALERTPRSRTRTSGRVVTTALVGGLVLSGAVAAAAAGALPGAAQQRAKDLLAVVGVRVPGPAGPAGPSARHPNQPGASREQAAITHAATGTPMDDEQTHPGSVVSDLARSASTGLGKGVAVSSEASDGKSHAGQHGQHGKPAGSPPGKAKQKAHKPHPNKQKKLSTHTPHPRGTAHPPSVNAGAAPGSKGERR